jgi:hypothetical protein
LRLFGAPIILTLGFALQVVITTTKPWHRRQADPEFNGGLRDELLNGEQVCLDGGCQAEHRELAAGLQSSLATQLTPSPDAE